MTERVNNGRRVMVEHASYTGQAGFVERGENRANIAFAVAKPPPFFKMDGAVTIDGEPWTVETVAASRTAPKPPNAMVVVGIRKV